MEPDYASLDPDERNKKFLAFVSVALGVLSLCAGIIPIAGIVISVLGLICGYFGSRSDNRNIAIVGIVVSSLGLLVSFIYAAFLLVNKIYIPGT